MAEARLDAHGWARVRWWLVACLTVAALAVGAATANAYVVHGTNGHTYGIMPTPEAAALAPSHAAASQPALLYNGGPVMLSTKIYEIFWGPAGSFDPSYQGPITQWAKDLGANTGRTTNEFSVGSLYYQTINGPKQFITRNVSFGGVLSDTRPYPRNGCTNPNSPGTVCLLDGQLQGELARDIAAQHWPTNPPDSPVAQYLIFTPDGVDSCQDPTGTSCTFSDTSGFCAYHSYAAVGANVAVYSNMPYQSGCDSGQAPSGVMGNPDTDGTLDSAIHEIIESATDPGTDGDGWYDSGGQEIGDKCTGPVVNTPAAIYGTPLGGSTVGDDRVQPADQRAHLLHPAALGQQRAEDPGYDGAGRLRAACRPQSGVRGSDRRSARQHRGGVQCHQII